VGRLELGVYPITIDCGYPVSVTALKKSEEVGGDYIRKAE